MPVIVFTTVHHGGEAAARAARVMAGLSQASSVVKATVLLGVESYPSIIVKVRGDESRSRAPFMLDFDCSYESLLADKIDH
jgi:hypothetical protein